MMMRVIVDDSTFDDDSIIMMIIIIISAFRKFLFRVCRVTHDDVCVCVSVLAFYFAFAAALSMAYGVIIPVSFCVFGIVAYGVAYVAYLACPSRVRAYFVRIKRDINASMRRAYASLGVYLCLW